MPVEKISIEVLEEIEENDIQTAINESQAERPNPHFQDLTTQDIVPEDPELLVSGVIAALCVEFNPLNYTQRKRIATEVLKLNFDTSIPEVQYLKSGSTLNGKSSHLVKITGNGHCFLMQYPSSWWAAKYNITKFANNCVSLLREKKITAN